MDSPVIEVDASEVVQLSAVDNTFYERYFFANTVRQESPYFHKQMDERLWGPNRYEGFKIWRGGAKTTKLRLYTSKRIAYAISHTILYVSNSQDHSLKSVEWIKRQVEFNTKWAQVFGLRKGSRWTGEEIEIIHTVEDRSIWVKALGITGQLRGFNINDRRPDLIVCDDVDNEETAGSEAQRKKTSDLFFGALLKSLAPATEIPDAKAVMLQTPLARGDLIDTLSLDPQANVLKFGCFDENGRSRWEARFPTKTLIEDKAAHVARGQLGLWMREMEVELVPDGGVSFNPENIRFYELLPEQVVYIITIDPASSDSKLADDQVIMVTAGSAYGTFVVEYSALKGEMPEEAAAKVLEFCRRYPILGVYSESVAYQRVLAHIIEQEMRKRKIFVPVHRVQDQRNKKNRILQALGRASGSGRLFVRKEHFALLQQYYNFSPHSSDHDDIVDALALALDIFESMAVEDWIETTAVRTDEHSPIKKVNFRHCP